jgi:putative addiction module component (TIGR02574 family)
MKPTTLQILEEVSHLYPIDRAELIGHIIESFDTEPDESISKAWVNEAERRLAEYKDGTIAVISEEKVFRSIANERSNKYL